MNQWYVITGGPSTGKTSLLKELSSLGYITVPEAARMLIDEAVSRNVSAEELRANEKKFQEDVARLKEQTEHKLQPKDLIFFDRGMHDTIAYMRYYNYEIEPWLNEVVDAASYKKVFLLEPLMEYKSDYARTESFEFAKMIQDYLYQAYSDYGMVPTMVANNGLHERVKFILDTIAKGES